MVYWRHGTALRSLTAALTLVGPLALPHGAVAAPASRHCAVNPVQNPGVDDDNIGPGSDIDREMELRPDDPDRDAPSEDGTAREPPEDTAPPGCNFQKRPLELLV
ncbi:MAG: hypothetical protein ACKVP4_00400 [Hyphomicrobium sp.]